MRIRTNEIDRAGIGGIPPVEMIRIQIRQVIQVEEAAYMVRHMIMRTLVHQQVADIDVTTMIRYKMDGLINRKRLRRCRDDYMLGIVIEGEL